MEKRQKKIMRKKTSFIYALDNNIFILKLVWKISKSRIILKAILTLIDSLLPAANLLLTRQIIMIIEANGSRDENTYKMFMSYIVILLALQIVPKLFSVWNNALIEPIMTSKINNYVDTLFFNKVKDFEYVDFENPDFYNKYTRALNQSNSITHVVCNTSLSILSSFIRIVSLSALILSMDWFIIIFASINIVLNFAQSIVMTRLNYKADVSLTPLSRKLSYLKRILYMPNYAKDIKCTDLLKTGKRRYMQSFTETISIIKKYGVKAATINTVLSLFACGSSASMSILMFIRIWNGIYKIADFTTLTGAATQLEVGFNQFFNTFTALYSNSLYIDDFKFIYNYGENQKKKTDGIKFPEGANKIEFRNVSFKYANSNMYVLKDISFVIDSGEKVAIVGVNGSGKTTIIKLLMGLYEPESGEIYINDINIKKINKKDLQNTVSVMFQDFNIYAYTVKENIAFDDDISSTTYDLLKEVGLDSYINSLPDKYDTFLSTEFSDNGVELSGGEAQKICFARAFNKFAGIVIMDEPSSAMDTFSEGEILNAILKISATVLVVTHSLKVIKSVEKIIMLDKGKVEAVGSHEELLKLKGLYYKLWSGENK